MKGRAIAYSAEELTWIKAHSKDDRASMCARFNARFKRNICLKNINALCKRKGWLTGRTGCFSKGQEPHNKGKPFNPPGSEKGRFKKGNEPHNTHYLGHERVSKDGYVEVSVAETNPHTGYKRRYVLKHRHEWEKANGPVPAGYALKCLDGNKANCDPANWQAIPRSMLPYLAGGNRYKRHLSYDEAEPEIRPVILTAAKVKHALRANA